MTEPNRLAECAAKLTKHKFRTVVVSSVEEAAEVIEQELVRCAPHSVNYGDSMTLRATGIIERIKAEGKLRLYDGFDPSMSREERIEVRRQGLAADFYLTGINAISLEGTLHWLDMIGNRIAPIAFGPRRVILVAGVNKIVETPEEAYRRIREEAAPRNVARHEGMKTPCAVTGRCSDCSSPDRICNERLILHKCHPKGRISLVLIDESLGL